MSNRVRIPSYRHIVIGIIIAAGIIFGTYYFYQKNKEKKRTVELTCMVDMYTVGDAEMSFFIANKRAPKDFKELEKFVSENDVKTILVRLPIKTIKSACPLGGLHDEGYILPQYNDPEAFRKERPLVLCRYHKLAYMQGGIVGGDNHDGSRMSNKDILDWLKTKLKPESIEAIRNAILNL